MQPLDDAVTITLRDIAPEDEPFLLKVFACARETEMAMVPWTDEQKAGFLQMQFNAQHAHYHEKYPDADYKIILRNEEPSGRLYLNREPGLFKILDITVLPQFRNSGIGTGLVEDILKEAGKTNSKVQIYVETFNASLEIFKSQGFSILEEQGINYLLEWSPPTSAVHDSLPATTS